MLRKLLPGVLALLCSLPASAGLFVCLVDGKKVFADKPCEAPERRSEESIKAEVSETSRREMQEKLKQDIARAKRAASAETKAREREALEPPPPVAEDEGSNNPAAAMVSRAGLARVVQGMVHASSVKMQVSEYYMTHGEMPKDNAELGLPPPAQWKIEALETLEVRRGHILLRYNQQSGLAGGLVRLVPDVSRPHLGILWSCLTPSYPALPTHAPQCKFSKGLS